MMRVCPKCGDYYADAALAFCLADGTPLAEVNPGSEKWEEGARVVEKKVSALRKHQRRFKWRRIVLGATTLLMTAMLVTTSFTVETTRPNEPIVSVFPTPSASPPGDLSSEPSPDSSPESSPSPSPSPSPERSLTPSPSPSPSRSASPSPSPTVSATPIPPGTYKIAGRVMDASKPLGGVRLVLGGGKSAATTTDANGYYTFSDLPAGGSYSVAPAGAKMNFTPSSRSLSNLSRDESADFHGIVERERETYRISGRVTQTNRPLGGVRLVLGGGKSAATTTDGNGNYTFTDLPAGGNYSVTATGSMNFSPSSRSFSNLVQNESANFNGVPNVEPVEPVEPVGETVCDETDRLRARNAILGRFSGAWRRMIEGERRRIIAEHGRAGMEPTADLSSIEYQATFFRNCAGAYITARYVWQVNTNHPAIVKPVTVPRERKFVCGKLGGMWLCS